MYIKIKKVYNEIIFNIKGFYIQETGSDGLPFCWSDGIFSITPQIGIKNCCIYFTSQFDSPIILFIDYKIKTLKYRFDLKAHKKYILYIPLNSLLNNIEFFTKSFIPLSAGTSQDCRNLGLCVRNVFESNLTYENVELIDADTVDVNKIMIVDGNNSNITFKEISIIEQNSSSKILNLDYTKSNFYFNSSIFNFLGKQYIVTRNCKREINDIKKSNLIIFETDTLKRIELKINNEGNDEQFEDPRILVHNEKLYISCATHILGHAYLIHQTVFVFDKEFNHIDTINIKYGKNGNSIFENLGQEKNWTFFVYDDKLMFVYKIDPHIVVEVDWNGNVIAEYITHTDVKSIWKHGECRGGTNPILKDGYYHSFFHSSTSWKNSKNRYYAGYYKFESKPPFKISDISSIPILWGNEIDERISPDDNPIVVFPCGAIVENDKFVVSFGLNDEKTGIVTIDLNQQPQG